MVNSEKVSKRMLKKLGSCVFLNLYSWFISDIDRLVGLVSIEAKIFFFILYCILLVKNFEI